MTAVSRAEGSAGGAQRCDDERWRLLQVLLRDLLRCLAPDAAAMRVAVSASTPADVQVQPREDGFALHLPVFGDAADSRSLLASLPRELDVVEYCGALVALYLEEGDSDSPAGFLHRVGMQYVRERVHLDPAGRAALFRRCFHKARGAGTRCLAGVETGCRKRS